ncbi:hypothetical protein OOT46_11465 [Aquabacterium sp. A7-Y]|uniref:hypothetical protein n=1 Tax=Aquabacterium sp. A7-Y TaxID=1349605 RepID=UPI00223D346B|nr:hypothetical protein [Aquabacterium sp. A7-Y]MCW7538458.1 hypothetical protein [Aquabacterium sp. A7-Y]
MKLVAGTAGTVVRKLRIRPYFRVLFTTQRGDKPLPWAQFKAYVQDNGGEVLARELFSDRPIHGATDADGLTPELHFNEELVFKFQLPGTSVQVATASLKPLCKGQTPYFYRCAFKTVQAVTAAEPDHRMQLAGKTSLPLLLNAEDEELIMIPPKDFAEFERLSGELENIMAGPHRAQLDLTRALEVKDVAAVQRAEKALGLAEDRVKTALNKDFKKLADLKEVIVFESYDKGKGKEPGIGIRRRYLPTKKYKELWDKRLNRNEFKVSLGLKSKGSPTGDHSVGASPKSLNTAALKESLAKIKYETKKSWNSDPKVFDLFDYAGNQFGYVEALSDSSEVENAAQWLRLVGGAGLSAEVDWKKKVQVQGNLQGKLVLYEQKYTRRWAVPSLNGWLMCFSGIDLGAIRFTMEVQLAGFIGAKATLAGSVGVTFDQGKAAFQAMRRDRSDSVAEAVDTRTGLPKFEPAALNSKPPKDLNGAKFDVDAFAGIEGSITPAGKLQWLPPEEKAFVSFAELSVTGGVNAGAGAKAELTIYYANGKFMVKASARLCWGVGAKGAVDFAVDPAKMAQFVAWFYYQLLHAGFKILVYVGREVFDALSKVLFLVIAEDGDIGRQLKASVKAIDEQFNTVLRSYENAEKRARLIAGINKLPHWLVHATPETRGMLLYEITRHSTFSHFRAFPGLAGSDRSDVQVHYLDSHKQAIINILKPVQIVDEWNNVMQHMTRDGQKDDQRPRGQNEGEVMRFLNNGVSLTEDLNQLIRNINTPAKPGGEKTGNHYLDEFLKMRKALLKEFPKGYKAQLNGTPAWSVYAMKDGMVHSHFALADPAHLRDTLDEGRTMVA